MFAPFASAMPTGPVCGAAALRGCQWAYAKCAGFDFITASAPMDLAMARARGRLPHLVQCQVRDRRVGLERGLARVPCRHSLVSVCEGQHLRLAIVGTDD